VHVVDFHDVETIGLDSSPVAAALAGLRANEARYFANKFHVEYTTYRVAERPDVAAWIARVLKAERGIVFAAPVLEVAAFENDDVYWPAAFYECGVAVNVLYEKAAGGKRAVGFKLAQGIEVPAELAAFKFARQKSKLAGEIRGSYFVVKGNYC
jgi:hypothetical protein